MFGSTTARHSRAVASDSLSGGVSASPSASGSGSVSESGSGSEDGGEGTEKLLRIRTARGSLRSRALRPPAAAGVLSLVAPSDPGNTGTGTGAGAGAGVGTGHRHRHRGRGRGQGGEQGRGRGGAGAGVENDNSDGSSPWDTPPWYQVMRRHPGQVAPGLWVGSPGRQPWKGQWRHRHHLTPHACQ